jgi:putative endonuclease
MHIPKSYYVYILTNKTHTVLYVGITNNLYRRYQEHLTKFNDGFTARYNVNRLVYYEMFPLPGQAIKREKQIKGFSRNKKINLINLINPNWDNLFLKFSKATRD